MLPVQRMKWYEKMAEVCACIYLRMDSCGRSKPANTSDDIQDDTMGIFRWVELLLLPLLAWLCISVISSNEAIAVLGAQQAEDIRVNSVVYDMSDTLTRVDVSLEYIVDMIDKLEKQHQK